MKNLLDIQCPGCGNTDALHVQMVDGSAVYLGPWWSPEEAAQAVAIRHEVYWGAIICCDACCRTGPIEGFDGEVAIRLRKLKAVWDRFLEYSPSVNWRK